MSLLYGRKIRVTVGRGEEGFASFVYDERFLIKITASKTLNPKTPNQATVRIYNMSEDFANTILTIKDKIIRNSEGKITARINMKAIKIEAGYGDKWGTIYHGQIFRINQYVDGVDHIVEFTCGDGINIIQATTQKAYDATVKKEDILDGLIDAVKSVGTFVSDTVKDVKKGLRSLFEKAEKKDDKPFTISGFLGDSLDRVLGLVNKEWTVQDNTFYIYDVGDALPFTAIELTPETGLIGSPRQRTDQKKIKGGGIKYIDGIEFSALFQPSLYPGRKVNIQSRYVLGQYIIQSAEYDLSSRGGSFIVSCYATPA